MPVVVSRDAEGALHALENRCAHRGALICMQARGSAERFSCIYHNWTYDHAGNLTSVAFRQRHRRQGRHARRRQARDRRRRSNLRVASFHGLVFGTSRHDAPPLEEYIGPEVLPRIGARDEEAAEGARHATRQVLPNNWKLYMDNVKDTYHASLLHLFFTKFRINRLTQKGGVFVSKDGAHHCTYTEMVEDTGDAYEKAACAPRAARALPAGSARAARAGGRARRRRLDPDPVAVSRLRPAPDPQLARRAPGGAQGLDRTELHWTLFGFADDDAAMQRRRIAAGEPGRPRRLHLDGGRRRHRLRAARRRRLAATAPR